MLHPQCIIYLAHKLPTKIKSATAIRHYSTFILVGGHGKSSNDNSDQVLMYNSETEGWDELPGRLSFPMTPLTAMFISPGTCSYYGLE